MIPTLAREKRAHDSRLCVRWRRSAVAHCGPRSTKVGGEWENRTGSLRSAVPYALQKTKRRPRIGREWESLEGYLARSSVRPARHRSLKRGDFLAEFQAPDGVTAIEFTIVDLRQQGKAVQQGLLRFDGCLPFRLATEAAGRLSRIRQ